MSNPVGARPSREEGIAFLTLEQVLGVDIRLADAGGGNKMPDGAWTYLDVHGRRGIVEITSPPDQQLMATWARAKKFGESQSESGSVPTRLNELANVVTEFLTEPWAQENVAKLLDQEADERHLFLFARSHAKEIYFYRLLDPDEDGGTEDVDDIVLPHGLTDV